jgi:undecaprenyl-diphosphatase
MAAPLLASLACAVLALIFFSWLAEEVFEGETKHFDLSVRAFIHHYASAGLTKWMQGVTFLGSPYVLFPLFAICCAGFLLAKWPRGATWLTVGVSGSVVLDTSLKLLFHRVRPVPFFGPLPHSYSFPSGHALSSFCFYGILAGLLDTRIRSLAARISIWIAAALLVLAIGVSRIYLGLHYPTDVIAGYVAAAVWVSTLIYADRIRSACHYARAQTPSSRRQADGERLEPRS